LKAAELVLLTKIGAPTIALAYTPLPVSDVDEPGVRVADVSEPPFVAVPVIITRPAKSAAIALLYLMSKAIFIYSV
jgi:hypothetical protein